MSHIFFFFWVSKAVEEYLRLSASRSDLDRTSAGKDRKKTGTFTGAMAINPISGEKVPFLCQFLSALYHVQ